jgi:hypothetical protein
MQAFLMIKELVGRTLALSAREGGKVKAEGVRRRNHITWKIP